MPVASASAQRSCRGEDDTSTAIRNVLERYVTADSGSGSDLMRRQLKLPSARSEIVILTLNPSVCDVAERAYRAHFSREGGGGFSKRVYVFRVGNAYVVADPRYVFRQPGVIIVGVFDRGWRYVGLLI